MVNHPRIPGTLAAAFAAGALLMLGSVHDDNDLPPLPSLERPVAGDAETVARGGLSKDGDLSFDAGVPKPHRDGGVPPDRTAYQRDDNDTEPSYDGGPADPDAGTLPAPDHWPDHEELPLTERTHDAGL